MPSASGVGTQPATPNRSAPRRRVPHLETTRFSWDREASDIPSLFSAWSGRILSNLFAARPIQQSSLSEELMSSSAEGERADILRSNGGITDGSDAQCVTPAQCSRVSELKTERDDAQDRWKGAMLIGAGFAAVSLATMLLWPNVEKEKKTGALQITPQAAGTNGGGVVLGGSF